MKIILLRHAESKSNKESKADSQIDSELTEQGKKEAKDLIPKIRRFSIDLVIISPLKRTFETVQPFLESVRLKPKVIISKLTLERNLGEFTGTKMGDFQEYCDKNNLDKVFQRPRGGNLSLILIKELKNYCLILREIIIQRIFWFAGIKIFFYASKLQ